MPPMERLEDKAIVLLCCLPAFALTGAGTAAGTLVLCAAVALSAVYELTFMPAGRPLRRGSHALSLAAPVMLCALAAAIPEALAFAPLAAYDLTREPRRWVLGFVAVPLLASAARADASPVAIAGTLVFCVVAYLLARRTAFSLARERQTSHLRDALAAQVFTLQETCDELSADAASSADAGALRGSATARPAPFAALTDREYEIVQLIADGLDNKQIAEAAYLGEGTVRNHISSILSKLNLKNRTQIAIAYLRCR